MRIEVVGAGSIGLLYTAKLLRCMPGLRIVTRTQDQAEQLRRRGLTVVDAEAEQTYEVPGACSQQELIEQVKQQDHPDWILLMVKQTSINEDLLELLKLRSGPQTAVVCFQNGIGHMEKLAKKLPGTGIYAAVTTEGARRTAGCLVEHTGKGMTWFGRWMETPVGQARTVVGEPSEKKLESVLNQAGFSAILSNVMYQIVWNKLVMNSVINPVTAILRICNGELLQSEHLIRLMRSLYEEAVQVAEAEGIRLSGDLWEQIAEVCAKTAQNHSSMLQDVLHGRQSEVEWINGSIITIGRSHGIHVPAHDTVYRMVLGIQQANGRQGKR